MGGSSGVINQTMRILSVEGFQASLEYFEKATERFRNRENREVLIYSANALESTLKVIVTKLGLRDLEKEKVKGPGDLIDDLLKSDFFSKNLGYFAKNLNSYLLNGLGSLANPERHGQITSSPVPDSYAMLGLHLAGSFITFLMTVYQEDKRT